MASFFVTSFSWKIIHCSAGLRSRNYTLAGHALVSSLSMKVLTGGLLIYKCGQWIKRGWRVLLYLTLPYWCFSRLWRYWVFVGGFGSWIMTSFGVTEPSCGEKEAILAIELAPRRQKDLPVEYKINQTTYQLHRIHIFLRSFHLCFKGETCELRIP